MRRCSTAVAIDMTLIESLSRQRRLLRCLAATAAIGPLAYVSAELMPSWPSMPVIAVLSLSLLINMGAVCTAILFSSSRNLNATRIAILLWCGALCLVLFALLRTLLVVTVEQTQDGKMKNIPVVIGYELRPSILQGDPKVMIYDNGGPEHVWTTSSLFVARTALLGTFLLGTSLLTFAFVSVDRHKVGSSQSRQRKEKL